MGRLGTYWKKHGKNILMIVYKKNVIIKYKNIIGIKRNYIYYYNIIIGIGF